MWYICIFDSNLTCACTVKRRGSIPLIAGYAFFSFNLTYAVALSVTKVNSKTICSNFPIPVINRHSNRKEAKGLGLSKHVLANDGYDHGSKFTKQFWTSGIYKSTSVAAEPSLEWFFLSIIPVN